MPANQRPHVPTHSCDVRDYLAGLLLLPDGSWRAYQGGRLAGPTLTGNTAALLARALTTLTPGAPLPVPVRFDCSNTFHVRATPVGVVTTDATGRTTTPGWEALHPAQAIAFAAHLVLAAQEINPDLPPFEDVLARAKAVSS